MREFVDVVSAVYCDAALKGLLLGKVSKCVSCLILVVYLDLGMFWLVKHLIKFLA